MCSNGILKHTIGENPSCWSYAAVSGPIQETVGRGPVFEILDIDVFNAGILDIVGNVFGYSKEDHTEVYQKIINCELKLGDMVHIPVYDAYSMDHDDIYFYLLIYDGTKLVQPGYGDDYGTVPPKEVAFPDFSLEYFPH